MVFNLDILYIHMYIYIYIFNIILYVRELPDIDMSIYRGLAIVMHSYCKEVSRTSIFATSINLVIFFL